MSYTHGSLC